MKKLLIATIILLFVTIGATSGLYAAEDTLTTSVSATVSGFTAWALIDDTSAYRSTTAITFDTVDGSSPSGWYYNTLATLDGSGNPNDDKSDVGIGVSSTVPFTIKVHKNSDAIDGKLGYYVNEAFNWNGTSSVSVDTVYPGTGFQGTTTWGAVPNTATLFYNSDGIAYDDFSIGISFALVPGTLASGTYGTAIIYTMTNPL